jgi:hypothetical protein
MEITTLSDPARFAKAIRRLAHDAHQTLAHAPSPAALRRLSRRIKLLGSALGDRRKGPLGTWLYNLGRKVRSAAVHRASPYRPMCVYEYLGPRASVAHCSGSSACGRHFEN